MNAYWYSWAKGREKPATFVAAWRHIVTLFRAQGVLQRHLAVDTAGARPGPARSPRGGPAPAT